MEITYNQDQLSVLKERFQFLKQIKSALLVTVLILTFLFVGGAVAIWMGFALIGVVTILIILVPMFMAFGLFATVSSITKMIKKQIFKVFRVKCANSQSINGSPLWRRVETQEGIELYFYAADPEKTPKQGEEIDVIIHSKKKVFRFGYFAIS